MNITDCKKYCITSTGKIKRKHLIPDDIKKYLTNKMDYSNSLNECLYRLKNDDYIVHHCPVCGNVLKYIESKNKFQNHCSSSCAAKDEKTKERLNNTLLNKYGENYKKILYKKSEYTRLIKYGSKSFLGTKECINKTKQTYINKYGDENYHNVKKMSKTMKMKYKTTNIKEKIQSTMKKRYGVKSYLSSKYINSIRNNKDIQEKINSSKRKNNTFNTSKIEEILYLYIKEKFPNVKRQYKDNVRYPYRCDFYIPELDYFVELQGYYTHGKHPFNLNSKEDINLIKKYKKRYGEKCQAITIWSIKDVEKRNCAKEHNLNFKEVWSLEEGKKFIDDIYLYKGVSTIPDECKGVESEISTDSERKALIYRQYNVYDKEHIVSPVSNDR